MSFKAKVYSADEAKAALEKLSKRFSGACVTLNERGMKKVMAEAVTLTKESTAGTIGGRDRHVVTGSYLRSWNFQGPFGSGGKLSGRVGNTMEYSRKVNELDTPTTLDFGMQQAVGNFDDYITKEDLEKLI